MNRISLRSARRALGAGMATLALTLAPLHTAQAHTGASEASSLLSALPVAVVLSAPAVVLSGGVALTVVAVQASAQGTVWVVERASDGARASLQVAGQVASGVGTVLAVTALSTGWVISQASQAVAFVPNAIGASLLYNERVTW